MKKIVLILMSIYLITGMTSCKKTDSSDQPKDLTTEQWTLSEASICAWFDSEKPEDSMGVNIDPLTLHIKKNADEKDVFSFIRLPMGTTWFGNEIENARLYFKVVEGEVPSSLQVGSLNSLWSNTVTTRGEAEKLAENADMVSVPVQQENDNWVSLDITDYVVSWLQGDKPNYGLVFLGEDEGSEVVFASDWNGESQGPPRLEVTGAIGERPLSYGKFGYIRHPENESQDAEIENNEVANCLSYALRDTNKIFTDDLGLDYAVMDRIYHQDGQDALADHCAEKIKDYVENHKEGLQISDFRQIDSFDSEIDADKEYRIAFRIGCRLYNENEALEEEQGNFDFHLWAQINNGQWAQKFQYEPTDIVPCTAADISPSKYPWDASWDWSVEQFNGFYTSKVIYFAVTKDAAGFTEHKK